MRLVKEGREAPFFGPALVWLYGITSSSSMRSLLRSMVRKAEGGELFSTSIRRIFARYHNREVGLYSGGASFLEHSFSAAPPGATIGRYTSLTMSMRAFNANHPLGWRSTHAFFYNPALGFVETDLLTRTRLTIGNDVWIGHNATLLDSVRSVGDGAVVAAGSVVVKDVPPYAIVAGYPAKLIRYRFSEKTIGELLESKWWEKSIYELLPNIAEFQRPFETEEEAKRVAAGERLRAEG